MKKKILIVIVIILVLLVIAGAILILKKEKNKGENNEYDKEIESFEYSYGSGMGTFREYKLYTKDEKTYILAKGYNGVNLDLDKEIDKSTLSDIKKIVEKNKISKWDGFDKRDNNIMDGYGFSLKIKYTDGKEIKASGYMKYPDNYDKGHKELSEYLEKLEK